MGVLDRFRLDDDVVLITGAASGIGKGYAEACADVGADLALADIDSEGLDEVAEELDAETITLEVDVSDPEQVAAMVQETKAELGGLDVVFANAGIGRLSLPIDRYPLEEWDDVMDVNLDGVFYTIREAAAAMDDGGSIVTTASVLGEVASDWPGVAAYVASKGGVVQLTKQAAADLGDQDIRVNAIAPGWTHTDIGGGAFRKDSGMDEMHDRMAEETLLGRLGDPEDLKGLAVFLASDASVYCTGGVYKVDGGWTTT
ncbi:SDR family oxidoreductase [Natronomonas halophila]|uniref:SDR family NAD(P)-dependent oxidoreductase n=1 Tax=Natronomonas halophila TaxID=2747817 RepID=UPI0015B6EA36|nr:SDR family oxidoreductase [Natronomonas halophila]QLD84569.1 SDR family oxidoreductase [Natronomonas halophila]